MRPQAFGPAALMLSLLLAGAAPARAASITFDDVVRVGWQARSAGDVRLRFAPQSGRPAGQTATPPQGSGESSAAQLPQQPGSDTPAAPPAGATTADPTLSQSGGQVEVVDLGDVTGTVCDCGEIPVEPFARRAGGFPWWVLGGIPLICVSGVCFNGDDEEECVVNCGPGPTPTPTPNNPVPEPATLLLFGSGLLALGARARRRYGRRRLEEETLTAAGEV